MYSHHEQIYAHSPEGEPPTYCSLFNHMVKAGGSTIKDSLLAAASMEGVSPPGEFSVYQQFPSHHYLYCDMRHISPVSRTHGHMVIDLTDFLTSGECNNPARAQKRTNIRTKGKRDKEGTEKNGGGGGGERTGGNDCNNSMIHKDSKEGTKKTRRQIQARFRGRRGERREGADTKNKKKQTSDHQELEVCKRGREPNTIL